MNFGTLFGPSLYRCHFETVFGLVWIWEVFKHQASSTKHQTSNIKHQAVRLVILDSSNLTRASCRRARVFWFFIWSTIFCARLLLRTLLEPSNLFSLLQFPLKLDLANLILAGTIMRSAQRPASAISHF